MTKRQPDSKAVAEARVELAAITKDLRAVRTRALALSQRLKRAARMGEIIGQADGKPYMVEDWCADSLKGLVHDGGVDRAIRAFARETRDDYRDMARFHVVSTLEGELVDAAGIATAQAARN
jgi:hypothetical protein